MDESDTNSTAEKTLALVSKHITDDMPVLHFLGLIKIIILLLILCYQPLKIFFTKRYRNQQNVSFW